MTKLEHPIIRSTGIFEKGEELIAEMRPTGFCLRLKGKRGGDFLSFTEFRELMRLRRTRTSVVAKMKTQKAAR